MIILGIETSCDETGIGVYHDQRGLLSHVLHSQIDLHRVYGGVVPELASRDHSKRLVYLVNEALAQSNVSFQDLSGIAYTKGPGLIGALMVGASFSVSLAYALKIPAIPIHHLEAHILASRLETEKPQFPFLALLVSGGHTMLIEVMDLGKYHILGETLDDAVGEAFDKTAKLLDLGLPGGPKLAAFAEAGDAARFIFPRPMTDRPGLEFSFSGLKTFTRNLLAEHGHNEQDKSDIAAGFEQAVIDTLIIKIKRALKTTGLNQLIVAGGVGANKNLRGQLKQLAEQQNFKLFFPRPEFCTDNGAMIAYAGYCHYPKLEEHVPYKIEVQARIPLEN